jgi:hypothetical protein
MFDIFASKMFGGTNEGFSLCLDDIFVHHFLLKKVNCGSIFCEVSGLPAFSQKTMESDARIVLPIFTKPILYES